MSWSARRPYRARRRSGSAAGGRLIATVPEYCLCPARVQPIVSDRLPLLRGIAGLAGMTTSMLHRIECGQDAATLSELVRPANPPSCAPTHARPEPMK